MRYQRNSKLLIEPPSVATGDIAFNLIIFFLVCASTQPDSGRKQMLPRSEETPKQQKSENIEIAITRTTVAINGEAMKLPAVLPKLRKLLSGKARPEDRVVIVKSKPDTPYNFWIEVTAVVEEAGGTITIQREEERTVTMPN